MKLLFATTCFTFVSIAIALDTPDVGDGSLIPRLPIPGLGDDNLIPGLPIPGLNLPGIPCLNLVTVLKVEDSCWPKVFPTNLLSPVVIESICQWINKKMSSTTMKLLFATTCFTFVSIAIALDTPNVGDGSLIPGLPIPGLGDGNLIPGLPIPDFPVIPCLTSVTGVSVCIKDLISSVLSIQLRPISTACCDSVLKVDDSCWPKVFPTNPLIPIVIESICLWSQAHPFPFSTSAPPPPKPSA
ncbi:uncharacterized protein LOC125220725 [Salvia hispanica]|uniref:uncharacterized protein LOC125220725 n=1 Tax=Salvia hispanica TaxID=49212 RepID=UPI0020095C32|nr:uncharacterized protein LOC125220725 [Salvia hispanica]